MRFIFVFVQGALFGLALMACHARTLGAAEDGTVGLSADADADEGCRLDSCPVGFVCVLEAAGPWCHLDTDGDGWGDELDNCPLLSNPDQRDVNDNGIGDACDLCLYGDIVPYCGYLCCWDHDGDGRYGDVSEQGEIMGNDNCPYVYNPDQTDLDGDGIGDACDLCPATLNESSACGDPCLDADGDGVSEFGYCAGQPTDGCPVTPGGGEARDQDGDGVPDQCDPDGVPVTLRSEEIRP